MTDFGTRLRYVQGLRDEIERLTAERDEGARWRRQGEAELRAEIARLLDVLKAIECHSIDHTDACRMAEKARAALEPKS